MSFSNSPSFAHILLPIVTRVGHDCRQEFTSVDNRTSCTSMSHAGQFTRLVAMVARHACRGANARKTPLVVVPMHGNGGEEIEEQADGIQSGTHGITHKVPHGAS